VRKQRANFKDLQDFLDLYYAACDVLLTEQDFYDLMMDYLEKAAADNVRYAEIFFDLQTHTVRKVPAAYVVNGLYKALEDGSKKLGVEGHLIMCFLRHLSESDANSALDEALKFKDKILGVGLDSGEAGNPPSKFKSVYARAAKEGLRLVAHAGEEGPASYITEALDELHVKRIDHGVRCLEDEKVVARLVKEGIPLTCCPCSNHKLQVYSRYFKGENIVKRLLAQGLKVTINSDDPAYFGGYIAENFIRTARECDLSVDDVAGLCQNAFSATFMPEADKKAYLRELDAFLRGYQAGLADTQKS